MTRSARDLGIEKGIHPAFDADDLAELETLLGSSVPEPLLRLLRQANGGHPQSDTIALPDGSSWAVNNFFFLGDEGESTESLRWNYQHRPPGLAGDFLPFARDGGGNLFVGDLSQGSFPVFVWTLDPGQSKPVLLAAGFEEFLLQLEENPDYI